MARRSLKDWTLGRRGREFVREVAVVLLGVLIALALEQVALNWRDSERAAAIRASMDEEVADFAEVFLIRREIQPCILRKLDAIDSALARGGARGPWRDVGRPPFFFTSRGAWNSDASDLLSRHLGAETFRIYGELYQGVEHFMALSHQEQEQWIALQTLERQDEPLAGERRWRLVEAAAAARNANLLLDAIAAQMLTHVERFAIAPSVTIDRSLLRARPLCRPMTGGPSGG
jgi:hypothetical protein